MSTSFESVPVAIFIFKRRKETEAVLKAIEQYKPSHLFVIADGPRNEGEKQKCDEVRELFDSISWPCKVYKNFSDKNMGGMRRVSSGISWVFEHVDNAIILEDDCVPHMSFFEFCAVLLEKYASDSRIMQIAGSNFQYGRRNSKYSYYFSTYPLCWGWATWKRAWNCFDAEISKWPEARESGLLKEILNSERPESYWDSIFQDIYMNKIKNGWDYRWTLACWLQGGLTITPEVNLVSNIGDGQDATHLGTASSHLINLRTEALSLPLSHNPHIYRNHQADEFTFNAYYSSPIMWKISRKLKKFRKLKLKAPY